MTEKTRILVVEDDPAIMLGLVENLRFSGYDVLTAVTGTDGLKLGVEGKPELVILDLMLPGLSGYEVCRKLREQGLQMPIIMLTARQEEFDKLHGFESGADDYMTKPFSIKELLARVKVVLLRGKRGASGPKERPFGDCLLDLESRVLRKKVESKKGRQKAGRDDERGEEWEEVSLTRTEFELLAYFCQNAGRALTRNEILNEVWGTEYYGTQRSLDSFVASLRAKIEKKAAEPQHILTIHGVGYKFCGKAE